MGTIRTLVLSGGGGRGAFQAGVYQYLSQVKKPGVNREYQDAWSPDIVVGTSIGAVNGAAIAQGISSSELVDFWKSLREHDIEGLSPGMSWISRTVVNWVMKGLIGVKLPVMTNLEATSLAPDPDWQILPKTGPMLNRLVGRWANLLDTGPLRASLEKKLHLDEEKIRTSSKTLLINATHVSTGRRVTFSNKPIFKGDGQEPRSDVVPGITIQRILASCSIPMVYPWTYDQETDGMYWDGAVVNNTPIGVAFDAARDYPIQDKMEIVVVMMTPWRDENSRDLPKNFSDAITWALDWALLASFRERLDLIEAYNRLGRLGRQIQDPTLAMYREVQVSIVAPRNFIPATRILDYDRWNKHLIVAGYRAAEETFRKDFSDAAGAG